MVSLGHNELSQHHACWWPGPWCYQVIISNRIDSVRWVAPCLPWIYCNLEITDYVIHEDKPCRIYSRIPLSRAPLTRENQLVALAPWTPNFSDPPLATAHMTEPVTHMCWSEQISPLAHSSQATWQLFNLGHCLEMHNTHLLGHAGQLSQTYFTHLAPILTPRNQPRLSTTMAAIARVPYVTSYSLQHQPKNGKRRYVRSISLYKYSLQVDNTIKSIRFCLSIILEMSNSQLFQMWFANL